MRNCTWEEIEALLRKYPDARKIVVENFLSTVANNEVKFYALENLRRDALMYGWNAQTVLAIREGIEKVGSKS